MRERRRATTAYCVDISQAGIFGRYQVGGDTMGYRHTLTGVKYFVVCAVFGIRVRNNVVGVTQIIDLVLETVQERLRPVAPSRPRPEPPATPAKSGSLPCPGRTTTTATMETPLWTRFRAIFPTAVVVAMEGMGARCPRRATSSTSSRKTSKVWG